MTKISFFLTLNALYNTKQGFKGRISHKFAQICIPAAISEAAGDRIFNIIILYALPVMATCMCKDLSSSLSLEQLGRNRTLAGDPILWLCVNQKNG